MTNRKFSTLALAIIVSLLLVSLASAQKSATSATSASLDSKLKTEVKAAIDRGVKWLANQQEKDGSYRHYPGITALVVTAYLRHPADRKEGSSPYIDNAIKYILSMQKPDGSIYDKDLANYNTALCVMALNETKNPKYADIIKKSQKFLVSLQLDEDFSSSKFSPGDKFYGGIGYGDEEKPDLSNLQFALQALKETGLPKDSEVWTKAIKFIERCQNRSESNDQAWASNDGGFVYSPDESKAGENPEGSKRSYASMTYAGLLSFIYANVDKNDPRVQAALGWLKANYNLDENVPIGKQGLFYNYHTMAKALSVYGEPTIVDAKGVKHNWYQELAKKLLSEQKPEGFWVNTEKRWWEIDPVLATAYAILALEAGYPKK